MVTRHSSNKRTQLAIFDSTKNHTRHILPRKVSIQNPRVILATYKYFHSVHLFCHLIESVSRKSESSLDIVSAESPIAREKILDQLNDRNSIKGGNFIRDNSKIHSLDHTPKSTSHRNPYFPPKHQSKNKNSFYDYEIREICHI